MASITDNDKQKKGNKDILKEMEEEISEIENENGEIDEEKLKTVENTDKDTKVEFTETEIPVSKEEEGFKDRFFKMQADFENYKKRIARDKEDMVFFLKSDILGKILPRIDDLERIINNTPEDLKSNTLFE
jgi:molecular chaperone GrpE